MNLSQFLAHVLLLCLIVLLSVLISIFGWGLTPQNWWWIIGGGVFGQTALAALVKAVQKELLKEKP